MNEHRLSVARTARYFTLGEGAASLEEIWFVCHGYGQLAARFLRHFEPLDDGTRLIAAPEGLSRFYLTESPDERRVGASWMTKEDRLAEIDDYLGYLDAVYADVLRPFDRARVRVSALGFSQGTATVCRWAALGSAQIDRVIVWGGEMPPDLDLGREPAAGPPARAAPLAGVRRPGRVFYLQGDRGHRSSLASARHSLRARAVRRRSRDRRRDAPPPRLTRRRPGA